jgi:hypothetical protein
MKFRANRWALLIVVALTLVLTTGLGDARSESVLTTTQFLDTEGVNTHINYIDGAYRDIDRIIADLGFLRIHHIRDTLVIPGSHVIPGFATYARVADTGVRFLLVAGVPPARQQDNGALDLFRRLGLVRDLLAVRAGSVAAIEGPNEINNSVLPHSGMTPAQVLQVALAFQRDLYRVIHADFPSLPVYYFTGYAAGGIPIGPDPLRAGGLADYNTQHPYPNHGETPAGALARGRTLPNTIDPNEHAVYTETGYSTNGGHDGVDPDVQAKYTIDLFLDAARIGIARTYLYELLDAYPTGSRQGNLGYGLFDASGAPKPAARAIRAMNTVLGDCPSDGRVLTAAPLWSISGMPETAFHLSLRGRCGEFLALWDEPRLWDGAAGGRLPASAPHPVTVNVTPGTGWRFTLFDPQKGAEPVQTASGASLQLVLPDHAVLLRAEPGSGR